MDKEGFNMALCRSATTVPTGPGQPHGILSALVGTGDWPTLSSAGFCYSGGIRQRTSGTSVVAFWLSQLTVGLASGL